LESCLALNCQQHNAFARGDEQLGSRDPPAPVLESVESEQTSFKVSLNHLVPQTWVILLTGVLSLYLAKTESHREILTVFPETPGGASLNSILFVFPLFFAATVVYLLVRSGRQTLVKFIFRISLVSATFLLMTWYIFKIVKVIPTSIPAGELASTTISACLTALLVAAVYKAEGLIHALSSASIGALVGTFLAFSMPLLSAVVLLGALVVYDILTVYLGPIGKLVESSSLRDFTGAVFTFEDVTVGMGDLVFYSMLVSVALSNYGVLSYIMSSFGVLFGAYIGMRMLEKRDYFPGLPLALLVGLLMMFGAVLVAGQATWP